MAQAPQLLGPDGNPIAPSKAVIVDGYGNEFRPLEQKDFALPAFLTVSSIISGASKTYMAGQFDEALKNSRENAMAMWRDCRIQGWLNERVDSVINLKWHLKVPNEKDPAQKAVKDGLTIALQRVPRFKRILRALLKFGLWTGRGVSHLCYRWEDMDLPVMEETNLFEQMAKDGAAGLLKYEEANGKPPNGEANGQTGQNPHEQNGVQQKPQEAQEQPMQRRRILMPFKNRPVNGDKINYLHGCSPMGAPGGTPLVKVYGGISAETEDAEIIYDNEGPCVVLEGPWRERFVIHIYDPDDADYYAPEMAGGIYGVGIRSRIYWLNWLRMRYAEWISDLFDRVGLGFICIKYDMSSSMAKAEAEKAAKHWNRRSVLAIPVSPDQLLKAGSIEVVEVPTTGAVVVQELVKYCDKNIERFILRQTMSGGGSSEGDGVRGTVGPAQMAKNTETQRIKNDAEELAETITGSDDEPGIISVMKKYSYPGADFPVWFQFDVEDQSPKDKLQTVTMASAMGVPFKEDEVRELTGMSKPGPGDKTVGGARPMGGEEGGGVQDSASRRAATQWIAEGKPEGKLKELAQEYDITRQAIGQEAKHLEGASTSYEDVQPRDSTAKDLALAAASLANAAEKMASLMEMMQPKKKITTVSQRDEAGLVKELVEETV